MCTDLILPFPSPYVSGRTMDFHGTLNARMCKIPVGFSFTSKAPGVKPGSIQEGKKWTVEYGFIGINYREVDMYSDGLNTEGLSVGLLWLGEAKYSTPNPETPSTCVAITDTVSYCLSLCKTVEDVKRVLEEVTVWGCVEPVLGEDVPRLHIVAHDKSGHTLIVEYINCEMNCYIYKSSGGRDTWISPKKPAFGLPNGVLTNSPPLNTQLKEYYQFRKEHPSEIPGGNESQDRFRRSGILRSFIPDKLPHDHVRYSNPASLDQQRVQFTVQVLNRVEITEMEWQGTSIDSYTIWSIVRDHSNNILYWYDNMNHNLRAIELDKLDFHNGVNDEVYLSAGGWSNSLTVTLTK
jgi:choloylglycine hydrolase